MTTESVISISDYRPAADALSGKTILLTAAADELGHSLSLELASHGATLILLDKSLKKLEKLYDEIEQSGKGKPILFPMDLEKASEQDFQTLAHGISDNCTQLDGLILNAAVLGQHSPIVNTSLEQWNRALQINLTANFLFFKHLSGVLNQAERASCIFVSDDVAEHGRAYWGTYATTKAACLNLIETICDEWDTNTRIHVNSINPGVLNTEIRRQAMPGENPELNPLPASVAKAFVYLLDPGMNWPNGKHFAWHAADGKLTKSKHRD